MNKKTSETTGMLFPLYIECPECQGDGHVLQPAIYINGDLYADSEWFTCPTCHGEQKILNELENDDQDGMD